ncbi:MAG: flagellar biosynthesis protein FlhF [Thermodesulfobacteriota bacterium]
MNIKRFIAGSNREALRMVKKEMGPDAVILRNRTLQPGTDGGENGRKRVEVTAAVDFAPPNDLTGGGLGPDSLLDSNTMMERWETLEKELRDIKTAILTADAGRGLPPELYYDPAVRCLHRLLQSFGLRPELTMDLMTEFRREDGLKAGADETELLQESLSRVLRRVQVGIPEQPSGTREIHAFIGPTGVGKTTTLAKLAALRAVKQGVRTVLITLDTFRIAAVSQLRTYGRIMGIPLDVASGRMELEDALRRNQDAELILIDTAGRSPNRKQDIEELARLFRGLEDIHHFLVLSATTDYGNLLRAREQFGLLPFRSYIFTKLDEVMDASPMLNFLVSRRKPVSYFTTGQKVPEDIEKATRKRLAKLLLGMLKNPAGDAGGPFRDVNEVVKHGSGNGTQVLGRGSHGKG